MELKTPKRGELIQAATIGEIIRRVGNPIVHRPPALPEEPHCLWLRNATEIPLPVGSVVSIGEPIYDPAASEAEFLRRPLFDGHLPVAGEPFAVMVKAMSPGASEQGIVSGVALVKINVTNVGHRYAGAITDNHTMLASAPGGQAEILWAQAGTGTKWGLVRVGPLTSKVFWAKITGNAEAESPAQNRWKYAWTEVEKTAVGYDGWATLSGGRSGTTSVDPAYNLVEDMNTGADAHVEGNGVDPAHLDTADYTFAIMPCTSGVPVRMHEVVFTVGETTYTEYWFSYENGVDGVCD